MQTRRCQDAPLRWRTCCQTRVPRRPRPEHSVDGRKVGEGLGCAGTGQGEATAAWVVRVAFGTWNKFAWK